MANRLDGKRALVTAAAQGIGAATARAFATEGCDTLATDINATGLGDHDGVEGLRTATLDVTDATAIAALVEAEGPFDILFNCAGMVHHGSLLDCSEEEWRQAFELNITSMFRTVRAVLPGMLERGGGSIINMSSICAHKGLPNRLAYSASKAAVDGFSKAIAADYVTRGIRCNTIRPGTVQTPSLDGRINAFADPQEARRNFIARQPMGRMGEPGEIAALAVYLASDESVFTTGTLIDIDGGMSI